jgi:hypothetical protein
MLCHILRIMMTPIAMTERKSGKDGDGTAGGVATKTRTKTK